MEPRLRTYYKSEVVSALTQEFGYKNPMEVPRLQKIVLNTSIKEATQNVKILDNAAKELPLITRQKAIMRRARKSIANFKLRAGLAIGAKVTLRRERMWEFLDRLISVAMPRVRDFRGLNPAGFDGRGNYSMGLTEQIIFPEIEYDKIDVLRGMNIAITTTAKSDDEARALLAAFRFPFKH